LDFLDHVKSDYLYLVGDTVDFLHLYEHHGWSRDCNLILRRLLSKVRKGAKVRVCIGNHDAFLGMVRGFNFGDIEIDYSFVHSGVFMDYLVVHGDAYDPNLRHDFLVKILAFFYTHFHDYPFVKRLKKWVDMRVERDVDVEQISQDAESSDAHGIVYGHTHKPVYRNNGRIINCGDWMEHATVLLESDDGEMHLSSWCDGEIEPYKE
jgi:UDP-2,3-diacylglucosamine pyrophosphatase LpxH